MDNTKYLSSINDLDIKWLIRPIIALTFIIYPFASFLFALTLVAINFDNKFNRLIVALFFGLFGFTFIPEYHMDITRHMLSYSTIRGLASFSDFMLYQAMSLNVDILIYFVYWVVGKRIENPQVVGFIGAFPFYLFLLLTIDNVFKNIFQVKKSFFKYSVLFLMFFSVTIPYFFNTMRNAPAIMMFLYFITGKTDFRKAKNTWVLFLPGLLHFSLVPVSILYLIAINISLKRLRILSGIMICLSPFVKLFLIGLYKLLSNFDGYAAAISLKLDGYILSGIKYGMFMSRFRFYFIALPLLILFPLFWFLADRIIKNEDKKSSFYNIHKFSLVLFAFTLFMVTNFYFFRLIYICIYIFIIYILYCLWYLRFPAKQFISFFCAFIIFAMFPAWYVGIEYKSVHPVLLTGSLLDISHMKTSKNDWYSYKE